MAESQTPEQVRDEIVKAMPAPLGEIYHALHDELVWLHLKWNDFRRLYAAEQAQIDLLNAAAPAFFSDLRRMMWEDVLLHLCRITDPPRSAGHDTLTLRRLPELIPDAAVRDSVQKLVDDANQKTKFARDWRNRRLAHEELPPLADAPARPLATASRQHVEDALEPMRAAMNTISRHYLKSTFMYAGSIEALGGVESLLSRLKKGLDVERAARDALHSKRGGC